MGECLSEFAEEGVAVGESSFCAGSDCASPMPSLCFVVETLTGIGFSSSKSLGGGAGVGEPSEGARAFGETSLSGSSAARELG